MSEDSTETEGDPTGSPDGDTYTAAIEKYLAAATWLTDADAPLKVHARSIATSLDRQMRERFEIQSALASSFDKVLYRLDARRPAPAPAAPSLTDSGPFNEESIFGLGME
ncbi:hypothetical protein [Nocardioides sp. InS609-2]|uniref:hypothetical protein n=1 Tax=Nocardioides sp. InS609-2 TaxID=2760705 RepID=UPI0020BDBCCB|nr:hypothetical protein [Nocardioides sp. InS609-2]